MAKRAASGNPKKDYSEKLRLAEIDYHNRVFVRKVEAINAKEGHYNPNKMKREGLTIPKGVDRAKIFRKNAAEENVKNGFAVV